MYRVFDHKMAESSPVVNGMSMATAALYEHELKHWVPAMIWLHGGTNEHGDDYSHKDKSTDNSQPEHDIPCNKSHGGVVVISYDDETDSLVPLCKCNYPTVWQGPSCDDASPMFCNGSQDVPIWQHNRWICASSTSESVTDLHRHYTLFGKKWLKVDDTEKKKKLTLLA
ncbi:U3-like protein [Lissonota sp. PSUC_FEM 10030012]|nr:U3-like protein [Lissonota sp. PSUC_FEM 10030012]